MDVELFRVVDEQVDLVLGIIELQHPQEELLQEGRRLLHENGQHEVRHFRQLVEGHVVFPTAGALNGKK